MVAHPYLIICELCELCEQMCRLSIFSGKCLCISGKVANKKQCEVLAARKPYRDYRQRSSWARQPRRPSNGDSIGSYPVLPTNNTRIAANCCDITTLTSTVGKLLHAAYLECELRRIVCWLLIVSAEIWKIYIKMYKQCSNVLAFMSKQRGTQRRSSGRSERYKQCSNALVFLSK